MSIGSALFALAQDKSKRADSPQSTEIKRDKLDRIMSPQEQEKSGLQKLDQAERATLAAYITEKLQRLEAARRAARKAEIKNERAARAIGWQSAEETLRRHRWQSAEEELRYSGYKELQCSMKKVGSTTYFVYRTGDILSRIYATDDVPFGLRIDDGVYWCEEDDSLLSQGLDSIIVNGVRHSFGLLAKWKELK
ncbi:hypothetical protein N9Z71_06390 [Akkermansiaceae bacterium]|nr:hypothetical protein [Akkermansiaceae bacterium]MDB4376792.1 hypothetical protein [Akkermansiaceae bacterium]